jgi:hypothetical protein
MIQLGIVDMTYYFLCTRALAAYTCSNGRKEINVLFLFLTAEALHLAHLMAAHGYFFPIDDHMLTVKNDNTFYRFQVS